MRLAQGGTTSRLTRGVGLGLAAFALALAMAPAAGSAGELVFVSSRCDAGPCQPSIWTAHEDGTGMRRLTADPVKHQFGGDGDPTWSPDGQSVAYARNGMYEDRGLFTASAGGGPTRRVLPADVEIFRPDWSPRGDAIAFESRYAGPADGVPDDPGGGGMYGDDTDILVVAPDGSRLRRLVGGPGREGDPRFSSDGSRVTFFREGAAGGALPGLGDDTGWYSVAVDGSDERRLTVGAAPVPVYSPDGRFIAIGTAYDELFTMRADGTDVRYWPEGSNYRFSWGSTGPALYFNGFGPGRATHVIGRIDFSAVTPRSEILPLGPAFGVDWTDRSGARPVPDASAPATLLLGARQRPLGFSRSTAGTSTVASVRRRRAPVIERSRLGFAALDRTGVRRVQTALGRVGRGGRCRFLGSRAYGKLRPCRRPVYRPVRSGDEWRRRVRRLRPGRHVVGFRASDVAGNRAVRRRVVRLR